HAAVLGRAGALFPRWPLSHPARSARGLRWRDGTHPSPRRRRSRRPRGLPRQPLMTESIMRRFTAHAVGLVVLAGASTARADLVSLASLVEGAPLPAPLAADRPDEVASSHQSERIFASLPPP